MKFPGPMLTGTSIEHDIRKHKNIVLALSYRKRTEQSIVNLQVSALVPPSKPCSR